MLWCSSWPGRFIYGALFNPEPMYVGCVYAHLRVHDSQRAETRVCPCAHTDRGIHVCPWTWCTRPRNRAAAAPHLPRSLLGVTGRPKQQVFTYPVGSFAPHDSGTGEKHAVQDSESTQGCMCTVRSPGRGLPLALRKVRFTHIPRSAQVFSAFPLNFSNSL